MCSSSSRKSQRGNALVEFAIGFSFLWLLFSGVYQYGYSFYVYNRLLTAVSNAAALGAKINYDTSDAAAFTTKLQNMVMYGDETAGTSTIVSGLTASQVNVSVTTAGPNAVPTYISISIGSVATPYKIDGIFGSISLSGKPQSTVKYLGQVICSSC